MAIAQVVIHFGDPLAPIGRGAALPSIAGRIQSVAQTKVIGQGHVTEVLTNATSRVRPATGGVDHQDVHRLHGTGSQRRRDGVAGQVHGGTQGFGVPVLRARKKAVNALARRSGEHGGTDGGASAFALTFVKEMEESTIPNNRPTEPPAELIAD